jgi:hypothetical protein
VLDCRESLDGSSTNALRRGIRRDEIGVLRFETLERLHELVELGVRDLRRVQNVVALFVVTNKGAELGDAFGGIGQLWA